MESRAECIFERTQPLKAGAILLAFALAGITLFTVAGCSKNEAKVAEEKSVVVRTQPVKLESIRPKVDSIGTLNAFEEIIISSRIDGILNVSNVKEGTPVSPGTVLALVDDTDYKLEVRRDEAALKQAEATLANTRQEYQRKEALLKEELVTRQQFDDISTKRALADADVDRAKAALSLAREKLARTKIISPLNAFVKEKKVSAGDYVRNGTPLFTLIQIDPIKLNFTVPERDIGKLKKDQQVQFTLDALPGKPFSGVVKTIYPNLEEKTRTLQVEAIVGNKDKLLKPGSFAKVTLFTGDARDSVLIPITSLLYDENKVKVFIVEGERAKELYVKAGTKYGEMMEITEGLKGGEILVVAGQQNLAEGVKVNVAR